jgi:hypothetical protein
MGSRAPLMAALGAVASLRVLTRWRALLGLTLAASVDGCALSQRTGVVVEAAPSTQRVVFRITATPFFYGLTVESCNEKRTMWVMGASGSTTPAPAQIVYGEAPKGFLTKTGPRPLTPGCYRVIVSGPSEARFVVNNDGTVAALGRESASP